MSLRLRPGHVAPIAFLTAAGLLVCSVADARSRATLGSPQLIVLPVFFRLLSPDPSPNERLALVCLLGLALYGVRLLRDPYVYTFSDELVHNYNVLQILAHHALFAPNPMLPVTSLYPGLEGATSALVNLSGASTVVGGRILIGAARLLLVAALFALFFSITGSARAGGLGAAIYTANSNFLFFAVQFSYESLALPLFVAVLASVWERSVGPRSQVAAWTLPIVLGICAIVVTHHLTSYALVVVLVALAAMHLILRRWSPGPNPWPFALLAAALCAIWLGVVASTTVGYLSPVLTHAFADTLRTIRGESVARDLFTGPAAGTPSIERSVSFAFVAVLAAAMPLALWRLWSALRTNAFAWVMAASAVGFFSTLTLRFVPVAWETGNRAGEFMFIGVAFVVGFLIVNGLPRRAPPLLTRLLLTGLFAVVFVGGAISGWPASIRLSQPLRILQHGRVIESERLSLARWVAHHLRSQRFVATDLDARLLLNYGGATAMSGSSPDFLGVVTLPRLAPWQFALLRRYNVRYVIVDRERGASMFFPVRGDKPRRYPPDAVSKWESVPVARVFDSGEIVIYDLRSRP